AVAGSGFIQPAYPGLNHPKKRKYGASWGPRSRPGLILFRPDGLAPAPGYQFYLSHARRLRVGNVLIDLPDFLPKRCRRLKPARGSYNQPTQDLRPGLILFRPDGLASAPGHQFYLPHAR